MHNAKIILLIDKIYGLEMGNDILIYIAKSIHFTFLFGGKAPDYHMWIK